jgi:hypothetical protein
MIVLSLSDATLVQFQLLKSCDALAPFSFKISQDQEAGLLVCMRDPIPIPWLTAVWGTALDQPTQVPLLEKLENPLDVPLKVPPFPVVFPFLVVLLVVGVYWQMGS